MSVEPNITQVDRTVSAQRLGRYLLLDKLGAGAMGIVQRAYDPQLDRQIAIKLLSTEKKADSGAENLENRLLREARAMARLSHPHVIQVYDSGLVRGPDGPEVFIAMELIRGQNLAQWQQKRRDTTDWLEVIDIYIQAGEGLLAAHRAGIVHRDFKPSNVNICDDGRVLVGDFGLAQVGKEAVGPENSLEDIEVSDLSLTATGDILGTPGYMSPEQYQGEPADALSDQFAFCTALYETLYGQLAFAGENYGERALSVIAGQLRAPPRETKVPLTVWKILSRGLSTKPQERYPSLEELLEDLKAFKRYTSSSNKLSFSLAFALLAAMGVATWFYLDRPPAVCAYPDQELAAVWTPKKRQKLTANYASVGSKGAEVIWAAISRQLDSYAENWRQAHVDACRDTHVLKTQSAEDLELRMKCLRGRRREFSSLISALSSPSENISQLTIESILGLKTPDSCRNLTRLKKKDKFIEAASEQELHRLQKVDTLILAAKYQSAQKELEEAGRTITASSAYQLQAQRYLSQGRLLQLGLNYDDAEENLRKALLNSLRIEDDLIALKASNWLGRLIGISRGRHREALHWLDLGEVLAKSVEEVPRFQIELLQTRAKVLKLNGQTKAAVKTAQKALTRAENWGGEQSLAYGLALATYGELLSEMRRYLEAQKVLTQAIQLCRKHLGPDHPHLIGPLNALVYTMGHMRDIEEAQKYMDEAIRIAKVSLPAENPQWGHIHLRLSVLHIHGKKLPLAFEDNKRALDIFKKAYGELHTLTARAYLNLGSTYHRLQKYPEAEEHYRKAIEIRRELFGALHPSLSLIYMNLGYLLTTTQSAQAGLADLENAYQINLEAKAKGVVLGNTQYLYGQALFDSKTDRERGLALVRAGRKAFLKHGSPAHREADAWLKQRGYTPSPPGKSSQK